MDAVRSFLKRHDPDLVAVVEALGKEVNGPFSELDIEEIDEDKYFIDEYDGMETVVTPDDICLISYRIVYCCIDQESFEMN